MFAYVIVKSRFYSNNLFRIYVRYDWRHHCLLICSRRRFLWMWTYFRCPFDWWDALNDTQAKKKCFISLWCHRKRQYFAKNFCAWPFYCEIFACNVFTTVIWPFHEYKNVGIYFVFLYQFTIHHHQPHWIGRKSLGENVHTNSDKKWA